MDDLPWSMWATKATVTTSSRVVSEGGGEVIVVGAAATHLMARKV